MMDLKEFMDVWNNKHIEVISQGSIIRNQLMADFCEKLILDAKNAYYKTNNPIMNDQVYDKLEEYLRLLRPNSPVLEKVGHDL